MIKAPYLIFISLFMKRHIIANSVSMSNYVATKLYLILCFDFILEPKEGIPNKGKYTIAKKNCTVQYQWHSFTEN